VQYMALHSRHAFFNGTSSVVQAVQLGFGCAGTCTAESAASLTEAVGSIVVAAVGVLRRHRQLKKKAKNSVHDMILRTAMRQMPFIRVRFLLSM
jgi:hypothetical protein